MSGIDSIQRRAWIAAVRDWAKSWYGGWKPPATYFTATFRHLGRAPFVYHDDDEEAQEAGAIVERINRAYERGEQQPFRAGLQPAGYDGNPQGLRVTSGWANSNDPRINRAHDVRTATHRCRTCGAFWRLHEAAQPSWQCLSPAPGPCCDNLEMGEQLMPVWYEGGIWHGDECCKPGDE